MGVNPFDEPNVTRAKEATSRVLAALRDGHAPTDAALAPRCRGGGPGDALRRSWPPTATSPSRPTCPLRRARRAAGQAARDDPPAHAASASTLGYGPRYLHSTGQLHKGGPARGAFLQLVAAHPDDLPVPGAHETFGMLIDAQALGDAQSLEAHGLPVVRIHLGDDPDAGLDLLIASLERLALAGVPPGQRRSTGRELGSWTSPSSDWVGWAATWPAGCTARAIAWWPSIGSPDKTHEIMAEGLEGALHARGGRGRPARAAHRLADGPGRRRDRGDHGGVRGRSWRPATGSSTAATPTSRIPSGARRCSRTRGIRFVDAGISGGVWGLTNGYGTMVGGEREDVAAARAHLPGPGARGRLHPLPDRRARGTTPRWSTTASSTA